MHFKKTILAASFMALAPAASFGLEEVYVTATKRSTSLQDTSMSISAITGEDIKRSGAADFTDLSLPLPFKGSPKTPLVIGGTGKHPVVAGVNPLAAEDGTIGRLIIRTTNYLPPVWAFVAFALALIGCAILIIFSIRARANIYADAQRKLSIPPSPTWTRTVDAKLIENVGETNRSEADAAFSGAVCAADVKGGGLTDVPFQNGTDAALGLLINVWGELPDSVRKQILRLADQSISVRQ